MVARPADETAKGARRAWLLAMGLALPLIAIPAAAVEVIGAAESVTNRVTGEISGARRTISRDDDVHLDETIRTDAQAAARLLFTDESDLTLGPQAQVRLDASVFSGKPGAAMQLGRGALKFFSGNGPRGSYQIRTPVATIGLRGTGVAVVLSNGRAYVTLFSGEARVCASSGRCSELRTPCDYVVADARAAAPARPLRTGIPTFASVCRGPACGTDICSAGGAASPAPGGGLPGGYDPAGAGTGAGGSQGGSSSGKGR